MNRIRDYARESVDDTNRAPPIANQLQVCADERAHYKELEGEYLGPYVDDGWSGGAWNRPAFNQMLNDAKRHAFNILQVWARDRLARDTEQFLNMCRILKAAGVRVWRVDKHGFMDMETADGILTETIGAAVDTHIRMQTGRKVKLLYESRKRKAEEKQEPLVWGRKPVPDELVKKALELQNSGLSCREIARRLPPYETVNQKTGVRKERRVSSSWVHHILSTNRGYEKPPPATSEGASVQQ